MSTAGEDMIGKLVVVTGFTAGLGEAAAFALAERGADLYLLARNPSKAERTVDAIRHRFPQSQIELALGDLGNLADVREMAKSVLSTQRPIDVLFNNAGVINQRRRITADGYEETFAVNHLGHFLLTLLLLEKLRESGAGRVVSTASGAHQFGGPLDFSDLQAEKAYKTFTVYGRSKLANILFTQELARREAGRGITANCFHPGFVGSDFSKNNGTLARTLMTLAGPWTRSPEKGAETGIYLCTSPEIESASGKYFYDMKAIEPSRRVFAPGDALTLWNASLELTGLGDGGAPMRQAGKKVEDPV
ncbi:MAG: SDR family NAD(P)-dependent oxidoreductase [Myxococcota bacterium]|nr:SDR family NAD(P)-dependent oxidoreductase [Myxococcota bacterium]